MNGPSRILLVDDRPENLLALEAILEPLGHELVRAGSGEAALKTLLREEVALILLDVQMPGLDGFQTAELIKERERTRHIPIIFLTALNTDPAHVFRGYSTGAVDYLTKPFDPEMLRSKASVFVDLHEKTREVRRQAELLREQELAELRRESEERYRFLADSIPQQVWTAKPDGALEYVNRRVVEYFGHTADEIVGWGWGEFLHPDDLAPCVDRWRASLASGEPYEFEFRLLEGAGRVYRWHLARAEAMRDEAGEILRWFGTNTDIDEEKRRREAQAFLAEAGAVLGASLDDRQTLAEVARLAVPRIADWAAVHTARADGGLELVALAHGDPTRLELARELQRRYPVTGGEDSGPGRVAREGVSELVPELADETLDAAAADEEHLQLLRALGLRSTICVPMTVRGRTIGAVTLAYAESGRVYEPDDLPLVEELGRRAALAAENARLYEEAEERAQAARVLASIADGVALVDADGVLRLWNTAAEHVTGVRAAEAVGRSVADVLPGWERLARDVPIGVDARPASLPIELGGRELWLSIVGVALEEGTAYAFRDLTEERAVERLKSDFVATVSHELRTPLAAIHGSAITLRRDDLELDLDITAELLGIIADESDRLARIVNDLLLASHVDSGRLPVHVDRFDVVEVARAVAETARTVAPEHVDLRFRAAKRVPPVAADPDHVRQVLRNLLDNAFKYSPEGGTVTLRVAAADGKVRLTVADEGLGIPASEQRRIFEKFYRSDPDMTLGIGGTGLGLYISRELVRRVGGRIHVESNGRKGSTFVVELPAAVPARSGAAR